MRLEKRLASADQECEKRLEASLVDLKAFFAAARQGTPRLSEELLGFSSKWYLIVDCVPYTRGDRHQEFLRDRFSENIFSGAQLKSAIENAVKSYLRGIADVENEMLVRMRLDLADLPQSQSPELQTDRAFKAAFDEATNKVQHQLSKDLQADVGCLVVSEVAGNLASRITLQILERVAVMLGVDAGILGTGAATSWGTFGASLVVAVIVDWVVTSIWDWWADPKGELTAKLNGELERLEALITNGEDNVVGLRGELQRIGRLRATIRERAVNQVLNSVKE